MRRGLYLQGGGAKGAFQAGVLYELVNSGVVFNSIAGTSIGAINGYFLFKNQMEQLKNFYLSDYTKPAQDLYLDGLTINNDILISQIEKLDGDNGEVEHFYVNYVPVLNSTMSEKIDDIKQLDKQDQLKAIKFSSLLPYNMPKMKLIDFMTLSDNTEENHAGEQKFISDLSNGVYDGLSLDGGMLNNVFIKDLLKDKLDSIIYIGLKPKEIIIENMKNHLQMTEDEISKIDFITTERFTKASDTLNFSHEFLKDSFEEGRKVAKEYISHIKSE